MWAARRAVEAEHLWSTELLLPPSPSADAGGAGCGGEIVPDEEASGLGSEIAEEGGGGGLDADAKSDLRLYLEAHRR